MIRNLRDIGGLTAAGGKKIKKNLFFRSAMLANLDEEDIKWMKSVNITKIYDLRTETEVVRKPDVKVPGIENVNYYLQDETESTGLTMKGLRALLISAKSDEERLELIPRMIDLYSDMVVLDYSRKRICQLIREMIEYDKGAILFHCTSGKDRTGMTAALLCTVLGVSREDIFDDYLRSLEHSEWESAMMRDSFIDEGASEIVADKLKEFFMLDRAYLENFFNTIDKYSGSMDNFIKNEIGLSEETIEKFRNKVLE